MYKIAHVASLSQVSGSCEWAMMYITTNSWWPAYSVDQWSCHCRVFYRALLQKRPIILSILPTVATSYHKRCLSFHETSHLCEICADWHHESRPLIQGSLWDIGRHEEICVDWHHESRLTDSPQIYLWDIGRHEEICVDWHHRPSYIEMWVDI